MNWYREISLLEICFAGGFLFLYLFYLLRIRNLALFFHSSPHRVWFKLGLRSLYLAMLLVAILGPAFGDIRKEISSIGKDIYVVIDLSESMNATDVQPSRLEKAKFVLRQMIETLHSDRIGIIVFAANAYVQCPLTYDQGALLLFTETLQTRLIPTGGTNLEHALGLAREKLLEDQTARSRNYAKIAVVMTDGEDFADATRKAAAQLPRDNVKLLLLGIGTEQGSRIPSEDGYKKDRNGNEVITRLSSERLRELAQEASGSYFELNGSLNESRRLLHHIQEIKGTVRATRTIDVSANKYLYPLLAALLLVMLDVLLTVKVIRI